MSTSNPDPRIDALRQAAAVTIPGTGVDTWTQILAALDEADRAAGIVRVRAVRMPDAPQYSPTGNFLGFQTELYEHRSVGPNRAWSLDAGEWCYPHHPCTVCGPTYEPLDGSEEGP